MGGVLTAAVIGVTAVILALAAVMNAFGQPAAVQLPPPSADMFTALAAGWVHTVALRRDGFTPGC
jgi:hypothetical protein